MHAIFLLIACQTPVEPEDAPAHGPASNTKFVAPDLDVDAWTKRFEGAEREVFTKRSDIVAQMQIQPGATVADIGAGTGGLLDVLVEAVGAKGRVLATELSPAFRKHMRTRAKAQGWSQVEVVTSTVDTSGLNKDSINVALMCDVYHHLEHPLPFLADLATAMPTGATLYIVDFDPSGANASKWVKHHVHLSAKQVSDQVVSTGLFTALPPIDAGLNENRMLGFRRR